MKPTSRKPKKQIIKIKGYTILCSEGPKASVIRWSNRQEHATKKARASRPVVNPAEIKIRRFEYKVTAPMLPPNATSPVMSHAQMEWWLNEMDFDGWDLVGYGQKQWRDAHNQEWWIFRRTFR